MMTTAIRNTMLLMNLNTEIVDEYFRLAGEVKFGTPFDRSTTQQTNAAAKLTAQNIASKFNGIREMFNDTVGVYASANSQ